VPRFGSSSGSQADFISRVPVEAAGEVEFEQRHLHRTARCAREADDLVNRNRRRAKQLLDDAQRIVAV
jgi:hypothetical protein